MEHTPRNRRFEGMGWKFWKKRRYVVAILSFFGFFSSYMLRVNLSVAIVDMTETKNVTLDNGTILTVKEFDWDTKVQGYALSSFFYGYSCTLLVGGYLGAKFGGKRVFGIGIAMAAALTLITPWVVRINFYLFLVLRILEGACEGISTPCIFELWSHWAPPLERTRLLAITFSGMLVGIVVGMTLSGYLIDPFGWPVVFYSYGILGLFWYIIWSWIVAETPQLDPRIGRKELKYITESLSNASSKKHYDIPWKKILTSVPVWALVATTVSENWGYYTFMTQLPKFTKRILKFGLDDSGFISAMPYLVLTLLYQLSAVTADWLLTKSLFTTTQIRKLFACVGFVIQTVFMTTAAFWLSPVGTTVCFTLSIGLTALSWTGLSVYIDIAPKYASIILGLGSTFGNLPGIISPILSGYIVTDEYNIEQWRVVICITAGIYLCGALIFGIFGSGELQSWARDDIQERPEEKHFPSTRFLPETTYTE